LGPRAARTTTRGPRTNNTVPTNLRRPRTALAGLRETRTAPAGCRAGVPNSAEVGGTTKEPTGSAKLGEEAEPSAPAIEEIIGHYEEESSFCGTRSYTMEIPVGDEVGAIEAVGKIFLEKVKISLT
jgi:hypothetical protein